MLTPSFEFTQSDEFLVLCIKAPYTKISETEIFFDEYDFRFYSKPYYLRLKLPGQVVENEKASAEYDSDKGSYIINIPKMKPGEVFEGLNLLTKLLAPSKQIATDSLIEVLGNNEIEMPLDIDEDFTWEIKQIPYEDMTTISTIKYGFANNYNSILAKIMEEIPDCVDISDPDFKVNLIRKEEKFEIENQQFSTEHYLADLYEDETILELLKYKQIWEKHYRICLHQSQNEFIVNFTNEEKEKMLKLPSKEFLLDKETKKILFLGLVDILLAFAYNTRTTEGENTVESAWTICKLSGTLSWLVTFCSLKEVIVSFFRRSLCFPLYRHWNLSKKVIEDTRKILYLGREYILKCLLEIHSLLKEYSGKYILNNLYITDYCIWIQTVSSKTLQNLSDALKEIHINKEDIKLDIIELEAAAVISLKESESTLTCLNVSEDNITTDAKLKDKFLSTDDHHLTELCKKLEKVEVSCNSKNLSDISSSESYDSSSSDTESEFSDSESTNSLDSSQTDSDDYSSSNSDVEDDSTDDSIDERSCLLARRRS